MAAARNRLLGLLVFAACKSRNAPPPSDAGVLADATRPQPAADASSAQAREAGGDASSPDGGPRSVSNSSSTTILLAGAGAGTCKLLRPALMQSYGGPAVLHFLHPGGTEVAELVFNEAGRPQRSNAPITRIDRAPPSVPMPPKTALPGCAVSRDVTYCPDASGAIHRTR